MIKGRTVGVSGLLEPVLVLRLGLRDRLEALRSVAINVDPEHSQVISDAMIAEVFDKVRIVNRISAHCVQTASVGDLREKFHRRQARIAAARQRVHDKARHSTRYPCQ